VKGVLQDHRSKLAEFNSCGRSSLSKMEERGISSPIQCDFATPSTERAGLVISFDQATPNEFNMQA
jgi:hypothetical protein